MLALICAVWVLALCCVGLTISAIMVAWSDYQEMKQKRK